MNRMKESILEKTNGGELVFKHYIPSYNGSATAIISPLRAEKKPSVSIFRSFNGEYLLKDFGSGEVLNCFGFVMKLTGACDFTTVLKKISADLNLKLDDNHKY